MGSKKLILRLGTRRWDHLIPLSTKDVTSSRLEIEHVRLPLTPNKKDWECLDAGEASLSRLILDYSEDQQLTGMPAFPLMAFRHRCMLVRSDSSLSKPADLRAKRVGLTGWPDSGNVWTKSLVTDAGVEMSEIDWFVGPLRNSESPIDRLGSYNIPDNVQLLGEGQSLTTKLMAGELDAIFTPTLPDEIYGEEAPIRHLYPDYRLEEQNYFAKHRFIPPIHVMTVKKEVLDEHPWAGGELLEMFKRSFEFWIAERTLLLDTTPWMAEEIARSKKSLPGGWNPYAVHDWKGILRRLAECQYQQGLVDKQADPLRAFGYFLEGSAEFQH